MYLTKGSILCKLFMKIRQRVCEKGCENNIQETLVQPIFAMSTRKSYSSERGFEKETSVSS